MRKLKSTKTWLVASGLFATLHLTPLPGYSQATHPLAIEWNGVKGLFFNQDQVRKLTEEREKGFAYYEKWTIAEVQLADANNIIRNQEEEIRRTQENLTLEIQNRVDQEILLGQCEMDREKLNTLYQKARKKNKLWPWIGAGLFGAGLYLGNK